MSPFRALFIALSKMPPALMLLVIMGLAVLATMMVTGRIAQQEEMYERKQAEQSLYSDSASSAKAPVMFSIHQIPEGTTISDAMIEQKRVAEPMIFNDALTTKSNVIGRSTKHLIPAHNQIREIDLQ